MDYSGIKRMLHHPHRAILILHAHPDADSVASNLALAQALKNFGSNVDIYSQDPIPSIYSFLSGFETIIQKEISEMSFADYDTFWALDMSDIKRTGKNMSLPKGLKVVVIDHHITNAGWGDINFVDPKTASTASILLKLFVDSEILIDEHLAQLLLLGILGDTSFFTNINTTPEVFSDAMFLIKQGADYQKLIYRILRQTEFEDMVFISQALNGAYIDKQKRAFIIQISYEVWKNVGVSINKEELFEQYTKSIKGANFGAIFIEIKPDFIRVSLRSRKLDFDVASIAKKLGGGGHKVAAGVKLADTSLEDAVKKVLELA